MITLFAGQAPTIMNTLTGAKRRVLNIENQIPFVETKILLDIPNLQQIALAIPPVSSSPDEINNILEKFKKLKEKCDKLKTLIDRLVNQIDKILGQLSRIERIFTTIDGFINFLADFIPLLRVLISTAQVGLIAQVGFLASGVITIKLGDAIKFAKSKLKEIDALARIVTPITEFIDNEIGEIRDILYPVRRKLIEIRAQISARCDLMDNLFIDKLKRDLELSLSQNPPSGDGLEGGGLTGPQGTGVLQSNEDIINLLSSQVDPEDILDNLENSNKQRFIEYLVENGATGYQIVKK